jgi:hypothetical protein
MCGLLCIEGRSTEWLAAARDFGVRRAGVIPCSTDRFDIWGTGMPQPRPGSAANSSSWRRPPIIDLPHATRQPRLLGHIIVTFLLAGIGVIAAWQCLFAGAPTAIVPVRRTPSTASTRGRPPTPGSTALSGDSVLSLDGGGGGVGRPERSWWGSDDRPSCVPTSDTSLGAAPGWRTLSRGNPYWTTTSMTPLWPVVPGRCRVGARSPRATNSDGYHSSWLSR